MSFKGNANSPGKDRASSATSDLEELLVANGNTVTSTFTIRSVGLPRVSIVANLAQGVACQVRVQFRQRNAWRSLPDVAVAAVNTPVYNAWEVSSRELRFQCTSAGVSSVQINLSAMQ